MSLRYTSITLLYLQLLFQLFHSTLTSKPIYTPTDFVLLSCGESSNTTSLDGRAWDGDTSSKFLVDNPTSPSSASITSHLEPSVSPVPYFTARTFHSNVTYIFPVSSGPKFVRLYFYPSTYSNLDVSQSFFSLSANHFTLLYNFSAFLAVSAQSRNVHRLVKEFVVPVSDKQKLELIFSPSPASFGFVNGIEIVSMPNTLYYPGVDNGLPHVGFDGSLYYLDNFTALETVHRLEVGGQYISRAEDTGMFREWLDDSDFVFVHGVTSIPRKDITINYTDQTPFYVAPEEVYRTMRSMGNNPLLNSKYNLTWDFPVDAGFTYLVRLHFCETRMEVMRQGEEIFSIFINNQTAEKQFDVIFWSGGNSIPVHRDYVVSTSEGSSSLWLALHPYTETRNIGDAILNGLEMFKLNKSGGNLAGRNPEAVEREDPKPPQLQRSVRRFKFGGLSLILSVGGAVFGILMICIFLFVFAYRRRKSMEDTDYKGDVKSSWMNFPFRTRSTNTTASLLPSSLCRRFSIYESQVATGNFNEQNIIGCGGFGNVYKGYIDDGVTPVAIKRLNSTSQQGSREFRMEIDLLSKLRHLHLVSLIGYCDHPGEMILVYEYMHRGTLHDHLYKTKNLSLPFKQRLEICIGAAKGLYYLHSGLKNMIIHRDVKSTNILLDENWVAKVSDFGLSRIGPTRLSQTHVSTVVKGSVGYVDPEYFRKQHLTEKSDVYSFGVVLLEVLCSRPPVILGLPKEQVSLVDWARLCLQKGEIDRIIDPHLKGKIELRCLNKFGQIAESCVNVRSAERPTMGDVVWGLEFALRLHETSENVNDAADIQGGCSVQERPLLQLPKISDEEEKEDGMFSVSSSINRSKSKNTLSSSRGDHGRNLSQSDSYGFRSENVFSEIKDPRASVQNSNPIFSKSQVLYTGNYTVRVIKSSNTTSLDGRAWDGDASSEFLVDNPTSPSSASLSSQLDPSVSLVPYFTARTFHSNISYIFPVSRGPKFVRLYFYPSTYSNLDVSQSFFSLAANHFTLLYNFSAFNVVSAKNPPVHTLVKEFVVPVLDNEKLELIFSPSPASFGFVNGIEIVSMPDTLYYPGVDNGLPNVGFDGILYSLDNFTAMKTVYRLEVGGQYISGVEDTGMFRKWLEDSDYIFGGHYGMTSIPRKGFSVKYNDKTPFYVAPEQVYRTMRSMGNNPLLNSKYNLTWAFSVDAGFTYLVRLHFCETRMEIMRQGEEVFSIFINNQIAVKDADVIFLSGGNGIPVYRDYVVSISEGSSSLWLALHPFLDFSDAILNGLEMFKLNKSDGNLAGRNPEAVQRAVPTTPQLQKSVRRFKFVGLSLILSIRGAVFGILIICLFLSVFFCRHCFLFRTRSTNTTTSMLPATLCRRFSILEIRVATRNFDEQNIVGSGGFGNVYKGYIDDGVTPVAIKRLNSTSQQGSREFRMEIDLLSKLRHRHLVSLIIYCDDPGEMILVYEYMHNGTLRDHLYKTKNPSLPFKQRLAICIGAAKGLYYLHSDLQDTIIHRDIKSTNILLDENWVAKVSDFGLSRIGPTRLSETHVSTVVRGSIGYVDPEYYRKQHLTEKSDVYSFGVVLLEVLCSRPPVILGLPKELVSLVDWARLCLQKGEIDRIIDPHLKGKIELRCLNKFGQIAESCVNVSSAERPTMGDVVWGLEFALQLQETSENVNDAAGIQGECSSAREAFAATAKNLG